MVRALNPGFDRRRRIITSGGAFDPALVTGGAVTAWLRNNTVGAIASVPEVLNPSNPAVQSVAGRRPTGNADGSMSFDGSDVLAWPITAQNFGTGILGLALWFKVTTTAGFQTLMAYWNGAGGGSAISLQALSANGLLRTDAADAALVTRHFDASGIVANTATFYTLEMDFSYPSEVTDVTVSLGGVVQTLSISAGTALLLLQALTGNILIGGRTDADAPALPLTGTISKNIFVMTAKQSGATQGLLTTAGRAALMAFEPLT